MLPKEILKKASKEFGLPEQQIDRLYTLWWREIKKHIISIDVDNIDKPTDINIPFIGKLIFNKQKLKYQKQNVNNSIKNKTSE